MERATSIINYFPTTKAEIKKYSERVISEILEGNDDPLKVAIQLKSLETLVKAIQSNKDVKDLIRAEVDKYGKIAEVSNAKIEACETGVKYDYSECGHQEYEDVCLKINELTAKKKGIEAYLKGIKEPTPNSETGEVLHPPIKKSTSSFKITL